jgi:hypothetical protein
VLAAATGSAAFVWMGAARSCSPARDLLIDDDYFCRSTTISFAGPSRPDGVV